MSASFGSSKGISSGCCCYTSHARGSSSQRGLELAATSRCGGIRSGHMITSARSNEPASTKPQSSPSSDGTRRFRCDGSVWRALPSFPIACWLPSSLHRRSTRAGNFTSACFEK